MGFSIEEQMVGYHTLPDEEGRRPFAFRVRWGPDRLRHWLDPRHPGFLWSPLEGEVYMGGLCDWTPCRGSLTLAYLQKRAIHYAFDFEVGGRIHRYRGEKSNIRTWNLPVSHTTCFGVVTEQTTDRLVSTSVTFFRLRDLPRFLLGLPPAEAGLP